MDSHLDIEQLLALAEQALGEEPVPVLGPEDVSPRARAETPGMEATAAVGDRELMHLLQCEECRRDLGRVSTMLAGAETWEPESLGGYRAVSFVKTPVPSHLRPLRRLKNAADADGLAQIGADVEPLFCLRSEDGAVEILVSVEYESDILRLELRNLGEIDEETARLYVPPGMIVPWPETGELVYPRYTAEGIDWSTIKLLYPADRSSSDQGSS
jgi:hypothetical protein